MNEIRRFGVAGCVVAGVLAVGTGAQGDIIHFSVFENAHGASTEGLNLRIDLITLGSAVDFVFRNESTAPSVVTAIYFESTAFSSGMLLNGSIMTPQQTGVSFQAGAAPPNPAGSIAGTGGAWGGNLLSLSALAPSPQNGLSPGESLTVRFDLGDSYGALVQGLSSSPPEFRVAQHVQGLHGGASVWTVSDVVGIPSPGAGVVLLCAAGFVGGRRRRGGARA